MKKLFYIVVLACSIPFFTGCEQRTEKVQCYENIGLGGYPERSTLTPVSQFNQYDKEFVLKSAKICDVAQEDLDTMIHVRINGREKFLSHAYVLTIVNDCVRLLDKPLYQYSIHSANREHDFILDSISSSANVERFEQQRQLLIQAIDSCKNNEYKLAFQVGLNLCNQILRQP